MEGLRLHGGGYRGLGTASPISVRVYSGATIKGRILTYYRIIDMELGLLFRALYLYIFFWFYRYVTIGLLLRALYT